MSSKPGNTLEDFLLWDFDIVVPDMNDANVSLMMAEALGNIPQRPRLTKEQFAQVVAMFEPYRESVEIALDNFDEESQSWRAYAGAAFDWLPDELIKNARARVNSFG